MGITKTLGGDRLGSGKKMTVEMHDYGRSTHNLSRVFRTTMTSGTLIPAMVEIGLPGDTFDIDPSVIIKTAPTKTPLFGSFKFQFDVFTIPMRLYNRQLHNNKLGVGMEMDKVIFPQIALYAPNPTTVKNGLNQQQISQSSLLAYLGTRGLGISNDGTATSVGRNINAMPILAYWDIFKNYYANKQEENAYYISGQAEVENAYLQKMLIKINATATPIEYLSDNGTSITLPTVTTVSNTGRIVIAGNNLSPEIITITINNGGTTGNIPLSNNQAWSIHVDTENTIEFSPILNANIQSTKINDDATGIAASLKLNSFTLSNIDDMREAILGADNTAPFVLHPNTTNAMEPYLGVNGAITSTTGLTLMNSYLKNGGIAIKTYQSDRFNNWLSTEWIDGENGIAEISAVAVTDGQFTMDALNLAQKIYNMLNRIAVSGGTYKDWIEANYGDSNMHLYETPIYNGGMSAEVGFDEVTSTAESTSSEGKQPLGTLAATGKSFERGDKIRVKITEPSYIMAIISLTPRIDYSQGNKWWTRLQTMNDLHKPELDAIGFQELITDEMAAWDTRIDINGNPVYKSAGKQPAYIEYMTAISECFGDFADKYNMMSFTLNRQYEPDENLEIGDLTTYIDPTKYNYAFTVSDLTAQNFWVQLGINVEARRVMSAKLIPNL